MNSSIFASAFCIVLAVFGAPCYAQTNPLPAAKAGANFPNPLVRLAPANAQTLADALRSMSAQAGVAFVAEGKPFRARNSAPPLLPVISKWPESGLPLDDAVSQIAAAYDYDVERNGKVFLLRKRYTNPADLPDVTADELRLMLRDVVRAASGLPAPVAEMPSSEERNAPFTAAFYKTLTPDQIKRLSGNAAGSQYASVSEFSPAQKQILHDLVVSRHIQKAVGEAQQAQAALRECDQKTTAFGRVLQQSLPPYVSPDAKAPENPPTQTVSALCCIVRENGKTVFVPFAPDGRLRFRFTNRKIFYRTPQDDTDFAAPTPADFDRNHVLLPFPEETGTDTYTLHAQALKAWAGQNAPTFSPQNALAAKSVTVVGIDKSDSKALWRAAGAVYGLHVFRAADNGPLLMQRPRAYVARDLAGLDAAAFSAFPAPLIRLYRGALQAEEAVQMSKPSGLEPPPGASEAVKANLLVSKKQNARTMAALFAPARLKNALLHRFRVLLEPCLTPENDNRVLYQYLSQQAHDLWTLLLCADCLGNASEIENQTLPSTITDFDNGQLSASLFSGFGTTEPFLHFIFSVSDEKGFHSADAGSVSPVPNGYYEKE